MRHIELVHLARAERRAAPRPACVPSGNWLRYSEDEGQS